MIIKTVDISANQIEFKWIDLQFMNVAQSCAIDTLTAEEKEVLTETVHFQRSHWESYGQILCCF